MHLQIIIFVQLLFLVKLKSDEDMNIHYIKIHDIEK